MHFILKLQKSLYPAFKCVDCCIFPANDDDNDGKQHWLWTRDPVLCRVSWQSPSTWRYLETRCSSTWFQTRGWRGRTRRCTAWRRGTRTCCSESESSSHGSRTFSCRRPSGSEDFSTRSRSLPPSCSRSVSSPVRHDTARYDMFSVPWKADGQPA